jgi:Xaa-Pro aminopeptidase
MWLNKRKLIKRVERMMVEEELNLHDLDSQHSRAYHTGMIDGLGMALFAVSPKAARRNPISIVWFDEDYDEDRITEQDRETTFDVSNRTLFESVEAK